MSMCKNLWSIAPAHELQMFGTVRQHSADVDVGVLFICEMCQATVAVMTCAEISLMNYASMKCFIASERETEVKCHAVVVITDHNSFFSVCANNRQLL